MREGYTPEAGRVKTMTALLEIGVVKSPVVEPKDDGWGEVVSEIHLDERFAPGLRGIEQYSHIIVVFLMHMAAFDESNDLIRRPRGRADLPETGIFAQRAKHRPNPLGITAVRLIGVEKNIITVRGLDAINGTPVLDVKPYFPAFDRVEGVAVPEWVDRLMDGYF